MLGGARRRVPCWVMLGRAMPAATAIVAAAAVNMAVDLVMWLVLLFYVYVYR